MASLAVGLAVAVGVSVSWPFARGQGFLLAVAATAIGCLLLGLLAAWVGGLGWGVALLAATFLIRVELDPATATTWTPMVAAGLLLVAELGYWSFELDGSNTAGSGSALRRLLEVVVIAVGAAALCALVLDLGAILPVSGSWVLVLGVAAVTGLLGIMLRLARRAES